MHASRVKVNGTKIKNDGASSFNVLSTIRLKRAVDACLCRVEPSRSTRHVRLVYDVRGDGHATTFTTSCRMRRGGGRTTAAATGKLRRPCCGDGLALRGAEAKHRRRYACASRHWQCIPVRSRRPRRPLQRAAIRGSRRWPRPLARPKGPTHPPTPALSHRQSSQFRCMDRRSTRGSNAGERVMECAEISSMPGMRSTAFASPRPHAPAFAMSRKCTTKSHLANFLKSFPYHSQGRRSRSAHG